MAKLFTSLCADLLQEGWSVSFRASGSSMKPSLQDGDLVRVAPVGVADIRTGDVLLYATPRGLTAHRVIGRASGSLVAFRTRADAAGSLEEQVVPSQVLGRVEALLRDGRERALRGFPARYLHKVTQQLRHAARALKARLPAMNA